MRAAIATTAARELVHAAADFVAGDSTSSADSSSSSAAGGGFCFATFAAALASACVRSMAAKISCIMTVDRLLRLRPRIRCGRGPLESGQSRVSGQSRRVETVLGPAIETASDVFCKQERFSALGELHVGLFDLTVGCLDALEEAGKLGRGFWVD